MSSSSLDRKDIERPDVGDVSSMKREEDRVFSAEHPNKLAYYRKRYLRDFSSEFLGTMLLVIFGTGADCQVTLSSSTKVASTQKGSYLSISFGWAIGVAVGVWVAGGSGGHINPVVTLVQAIFRGFPWRKVPIYITAQLLGALSGALLIYANYSHAIDLFEGHGLRTEATASLFTTYALDYMPSAACFFDEFLGTAILIIAVLGITDNTNIPPTGGLLPVALFILILGEGISLGMQTAYALNPARDLGPRIALAIVGYNKSVLWNYRDQYWLWVPILGPLCGGMIGAIVYDVFMFLGSESVFNRPSKAALARQRIPPEERKVAGKGGIRTVMPTLSEHAAAQRFYLVPDATPCSC
ncbi:aquaporin-like protein [Cantharellus anzutake]|uniref:aquaporin-like protein n=1 Tax=Cantharellus anzutake TaxID=1750568 RepID=UPI001908BA30|nr:aquaporin-like protein [Cantharellus anzutake]KAF8337924.1 aquaporin-like protein [Cantharellus anzutake]